jgi:hypothetical protein
MRRVVSKAGRYASETLLLRTASSSHSRAFSTAEDAAASSSPNCAAVFNTARTNPSILSENPEKDTTVPARSAGAREDKANFEAGGTRRVHGRLYCVTCPTASIHSSCAYSPNTSSWVPVSRKHLCSHKRTRSCSTHLLDLLLTQACSLAFLDCLVQPVELACTVIHLRVFSDEEIDVFQRLPSQSRETSDQRAQACRAVVKRRQACRAVVKRRQAGLIQFGLTASNAAPGRKQPGRSPASCHACWRACTPLWSAQAQGTRKVNANAACRSRDAQIVTRGGAPSLLGSRTQCPPGSQ